MMLDHQHGLGSEWLGGGFREMGRWVTWGVQPCCGQSPMGIRSMVSSPSCQGPRHPRANIALG